MERLKLTTIQRLIRSRKYRAQQGWFVAEGERWLLELIEHKHQIVAIVTTKEFMQQFPHTANVNSLPHTTIDPGEMKRLSDTMTPAGVLMVAKQLTLPLPKKISFGLILDGLKDPGNVGTLFRSASGAGVDAVFLSPGTVDAYNPKVVRAAMGAHLRLPIISDSWEQIGEHLAETIIRGADAKGVNEYTSVDWTRPSSLVIGNEAHGLSAAAKTIIGEVVTIRLKRETESLNAAMAGSVILFEAMRQRSSL